MANTLGTAKYRYFNDSTRYSGGITESIQGVDTINILTCNIKETFMDIWFFDAPFLHGRNPHYDATTDTTVDTPFTVGSDVLNTFQWWKPKSGQSPLVNKPTLVVDNSVEEQENNLCDVTFTVRPTIWNDIYGNVAKNITFNVPNLKYYVLNPCYEVNAAYPDFIGNKIMIPNSMGLIKAYIENVIAHAGYNFEYGTHWYLTQELSKNYPASSPEIRYTSTRVRNKFGINDILLTSDEQNQILAAIYGIVPSQIVFTAHN